MHHIKTFKVVPAIPEPIADLRKLAYNLWWVWNHDAVALFQRLDRRLWDHVRHNPVQLLAEVSQSRLEQVAQDPAYLAHLERVMTALDEYLNSPSWFNREFPDGVGKTLAYFSMEFGLHECLPQYSGGLGGLAGDHMKSASDLGLPLVGIGLFYHQGYFQQYLSNDGWQFEDYPDLDIHHMPVERVLDTQAAAPPGADARVKDESGQPVAVHVVVGPRTVAVQMLKVTVGRTAVYFLDTNIPENHPDDRAITLRLYGGDQEMRIRQEIVLGFGGCQALRAMGYQPTLYHMNEGHSAFLSLERVCHLVETRSLSFAEAREAVAGSTLFTTHTPVPAGIDMFPRDLVDRYLSPYAERMKTNVATLIALGQAGARGDGEHFSMATLALRLSRLSNAVSRRHGEVARQMWRSQWPQVPSNEIPITSVTNGAHVRSWLSAEISQLLDRYLGPDWIHNTDDSAIWKRVDEIPDAELWRAHERARERHIVELRAHLREQLVRRGAPLSQIEEADEIFNPEALTIGFARRFAPYKRATLLLRDEQRLLKLLGDTQRPIQFVFAGKAHPRDDMGKELIKRLIQFARRPDARHRFAFVENYNIDVARTLVQGVDLWMNTPTKPLEASGTSGMKVAPNGGINFSVLDGWWCEAYDGSNGWIIGDERTYDNADYQDQVESESIYELLETEIVPTFYDRGSDGLPRRWIARMKASMRTCAAQFSAARMVREYTRRLYMPIMHNGLHLEQNDFAAARSLAAWKTHIAQRWESVRIESFQADGGEKSVGSQLPVRARVRLGKVSPNEVVVQLYHGPLPRNGTLDSGEAVNMVCENQEGDGAYEYTGAIPCQTSGQYAFGVRILPSHPDIPGHHDMSLIKWA